MIKIIFQLLVGLCLLPVVAIAQQIEINVHTQLEPKSALGIFFASGKVVQQPNATFERINEDTVVVRMPYAVSSLPSASPFATAYLLTAENEIVFGDVRMVSAADSSESFWKIPACKEQTKNTSKMLLPEQLNYLDSLLAVRNKKRDVAHQLISEKMNEELVSRLQKWEVRFGMKNDTLLSPELPALELVERLTRLKDAILLFRSTKESVKPTEAPTPKEEPKEEEAFEEIK